jgi:uncharacterized protein
MVDIVKNNLEGIAEACKKYKVKELYLFGSAAQEKDFGPESDIDFLYTIDLDNFSSWDSDTYDYIDNIIDLESTLTNLLKRKIDLVPNVIISNKYLKRSIEASKQIVYAA